jgi:ArsR family transcriptional regulator, arsenate/arsenite/antimonite-responsive transcriptional repressor
MARSDDNHAFSALADPTRRSILTLLSERRSSTAGSIAEEFPEMSRPAISAHLRVLRNAKLVEERHDGKYRVYSLGPNRASEVVAFLTEVYAASLADLHSAAEDAVE